MIASLGLFYFLAVVLLFAAIRVVTTRHPVHAALFLVLSFFNAAALWFLLQAEFLAITLILVYVGAVMVLFLFVVMMLDNAAEKLRAGFWSNLPLAALVASIMAGEMLAVLLSDRAIPLDNNLPLDSATTVRALGLELYTNYLYPFELAGILLLLAVVAATALTLRKRKESKYLDPAIQVQAKKADRLRIIKMQSEAGSPDFKADSNT